MNNQNSKFAELIKTAKTENVYIFTNKDKELLLSLHPLPGNRPINNKRVEEIAEALSHNEFIPPIIVSLPYRFITEGNHRYMAAMKCLEENKPFQLKVYMYKDEKALATARVINNTQKRWTAADKLMSYCYEGKSSYLKLKSFMDDYPELFKKSTGYVISPALCLMAGENRTRASMEQAFNSGVLVIKDSHVNFAHEILKELIAISEILNSSQPIARDAINGWVKARTRLGMPVAQFYKKLKKKASSWEAPRDSAAAWFNMYINIAGGF